jgi:hypothetical protein
MTPPPPHLEAALDAIGVRAVTIREVTSPASYGTREPWKPEYPGHEPPF